VLWLSSEAAWAYESAMVVAQQRGRLR
jgi:hypothetical protein